MPGQFFSCKAAVLSISQKAKVDPPEGRSGPDIAAHDHVKQSQLGGVLIGKLKPGPGSNWKIKTVRSRLYRSQILQVNIRWKALAEIYTMHSFAPFSWDQSSHVCTKIAENFANFFAKFR